MNASSHMKSDNSGELKKRDPYRRRAQWGKGDLKPIIIHAYQVRVYWEGHGVP